MDPVRPHDVETPAASVAVACDVQLAPGTAHCVERELARVRQGFKDSLTAKKTFDVSLVLGKAP